MSTEKEKSARDLLLELRLEIAALARRISVPGTVDTFTRQLAVIDKAVALLSRETPAPEEQLNGDYKPDGDPVVFRKAVLQDIARDIRSRIGNVPFVMLAFVPEGPNNSRCHYVSNGDRAFVWNMVGEWVLRSGEEIPPARN